MEAEQPAESVHGDTAATIGAMDQEQASVRQVWTAELSDPEVDAIRDLLWAAFDDEDPEERFTEDDWHHTIGGLHVVAEEGSRIVAHASVVERRLEIAGRAVRTGYVEGVATAPDRQGRGLGTLVMEHVSRVIAEGYELGALGTGRHAFYERLGWHTWRGPSFVRTPDGEQRTREDDGFILVLATPASPPLDFDASISCDWRPGDVW
jgi:aminoglycoside 2'-N-acetyltransferase I